jgi:intron-binding protein aquarius
MPNAKRLKGNRATKAGGAREPPADVEAERPTPAEVEEEEHQFVQLARKNWLKARKKAVKVKVKTDVLKQGIWDVLEQDGFQYKSLLLLESLQTLERCASNNRIWAETCRLN